MKNSLKNFPEIKEGLVPQNEDGIYEWKKLSIKQEENLILCKKWKEEFEEELREQLLPRVIGAMAELVDDRSNFQKGWKIGYIDCIKAILGD